MREKTLWHGNHTVSMQQVNKGEMGNQGGPGHRDYSAKESVTKRCNKNNMRVKESFLFAMYIK